MNWLGRRIVVAVLIAGTLGLLWFPLEVRVLWPSGVALVLVFLTRKVMLSLLLGGFVGSLLLVGGNPLRAFLDLVELHLLPHFSSSWKVGAVIFTLLMGGLVALLERSGGMTALFQRWLQRPGRRRVETVACAGGLICFFDGLANALMIGRLMQPFARQAKLSAARLAYVVDTTSSAVACLAFVSTWIAYQLAMIHEGYVLAGREAESQPYLTFFQSIPYNYYCWFALALLAIVVFRQIQWGPMRTYTRPPAVAKQKLEPFEPVDSSPWRALGAIAVLLVGIPVGIYFDGVRRADLEAWPVSAETVSMAFGAAHTPLILIAASVLASLVALVSLPASRRRGSSSAYLEGLEQLFRPVLILISAWVLSSTLNELEAGAFLAQLVGDHLAADFLPLVVFLAGALIAFSTGTSWGTMGLLMPLSVAMCLNLPETPAYLIPAVVGAVFSGAVFGDHCSPISDTTIVSSIACGIDPFDHVRTQLPYALFAAGWSIVVGFLLLTIFPVKPLVLPIGLLAMGGLLLWRSRGADRTTV